MIEDDVEAKNINQPVITGTQGALNVNPLSAGTIQSSTIIQPSTITTAFQQGNTVQASGNFVVSPAWYEDFKPVDVPRNTPVEYMVILRYVDAGVDEVKTKTVFVNGTSVTDAVRTATIKYNLKEHIVSGWAFASCDMSQIL